MPPPICAFHTFWDVLNFPAVYVEYFYGCSLLQVEGVSYLSSFLHRSKDMFLWMGERGTNVLDSGAPFYDTYETKDGKFVSVGALEPQFYKHLIEGITMLYQYQ